MAAGSTYTKIASSTLGSAAASVTFSSIPSIYTDLVLVVTPASASGTPNVLIRVNSDSGSNYSWTGLAGNGTSATSGREINTVRAYGTIQYYSAMTTTLGTCTMKTDFMNYANTTTQKTWLSRAGGAGYATELIVGKWASTAAITTLDCYAYVGAGSFVNFAIGSTFNLYGILAA
jgi:hypothetical protein